MSLIDLKEKMNQFPTEPDKVYIDKCHELHKQFLDKYPFKEHPEKIDELTQDDIYAKGGDYFFLWVEHKLKSVGHLSIGSAAYLESARNNLDRLKVLLRICIDDAITISQKTDAGWEEIPWFGGDRHVAKKIIYLYNYNKTLPIFKTEHMEFFLTNFGVNYEREALAKYGKGYGVLSLGQKYELLTELLLKSKPKEWDNLSFGVFLYNNIPPPKAQWWINVGSQKTSEPSPMHRLGLLFEPEYEQEVVYLFSVLHRELGFPYIIHISGAYPDATVIDNQKQPRKVEFELKSSGFMPHLSETEKADFIICWENDLTENDLIGKEGFPKIITLKDFLEEEG
jgi:hypothetical protein